MASTRTSRGTTAKKRAGATRAAGAVSGARRTEGSAPRRTAAKPKAAARSAGEKKRERWNLRLYVAGDSPKSRTALENLRRLCDAHLGVEYHIEVVDLRTRPELAKADQILALPTLVRKIPEPVKRVIGDLSNAERALVGLELLK